MTATDIRPPDESLRPALEALANTDADMARAYESCGLPPLRRSEPGFAGLLRMIAAQQVSAGAARAIIARLDAALGEMTPAAVAATPEDELRAAGLSRPKIAYAKSMAEAALESRIDFAGLADLPDRQVIAQLTALKGIGRWTAEIYLLFALNRPDVFPAGDLALQVAAQRLKGLGRRPSEKYLRRIAAGWRPYRGPAARFLWHIYRHPGMPD
jgi:DNA-3-methyladenine glycosylase II